MTFEYKVLTMKAEGFWGGKVDKESYEEQLNRLGAEGWELINSYPTTEAYGKTIGIISVFKRTI